MRKGITLKNKKKKLLETGKPKVYFFYSVEKVPYATLINKLYTTVEYQSIKDLILP